MPPRHVAWLLAVVPLLVALWPRAGLGHPPQAPDEVPSEVASAWFDQLYDLVKAEQITPPPASRLYGLAAVTLYEALVPGSRAHRSLAGQLNALTFVPRPALPRCQSVVAESRIVHEDTMPANRCRVCADFVPDV